METLGLTAFDAIGLAIIILSAVMAFARGLIREVFSIVAFFAAMFAALYGHRYVAPLLEGAVGNVLFATLFAGFLIFLVVFVGITILTSILAKAAHSSGEIGALDRGVGLLFGAARGILIVALFVVLVRAVTGPAETTPQAATPTWLTEARTYPFFSRTARVLESLAPKAKELYRQRKDQIPAPEGAPA
jgi:membrane protein required for colicin V production